MFDVWFSKNIFLPQNLHPYIHHIWQHLGYVLAIISDLGYIIELYVVQTAEVIGSYMLSEKYTLKIKKQQFQILAKKT